MDITKFPTDNLYKFLAIFGLVILIISVYYPFQLQNQFEKLNADIRTDLDLLHDSVLRQKDRINSLNELVDSSSNKNNEYLLSSQKEEKIKANNFKKDISIIEKNNNEIININYELNIFKYIASVLIPLGSLMMIVGFYFWYTKLQRYQDIILKGETQKIIDNIKKQ